MNCEIITEKFNKIKSKNEQKNNYIFRIIWNEITSADENIFEDEDIIGIITIRILRESGWLDVNNLDDFDNVKEFVNSVILFVNDNKAILHDKRNYNDLVSCVLGRSEGWGGKREGSGRKPTGRKRRFLYLTDEESAKVDEFVKKLREE